MRTAARQSEESMPLQTVNSSASSTEGSVEVGTLSIAQQAVSPESTPVMAPPSDAEVTVGRRDGALKAPTGEEQHVVQAASSMDDSAVEQTICVAICGAAADSQENDSLRAANEDAPDLQQQAVLETGAIDETPGLSQFQAECTAAQQSSKKQQIPKSADIVLEAFLSGSLSVIAMHADNEVLAMSTAKGLVSAVPQQSPKCEAEGLAVRNDAGPRLARLVQQTGVLKAKMAAAIACIRELEAEKAAAARHLAAIYSESQVPLFPNTV